MAEARVSADLLQAEQITSFSSGYEKWNRTQFCMSQDGGFFMSGKTKEQWYITKRTKTGEIQWTSKYFDPDQPNKPCGLMEISFGHKPFLITSLAAAHRVVYYEVQGMQASTPYLALEDEKYCFNQMTLLPPNVGVVLATSTSSKSKRILFLRKNKAKTPSFRISSHKIDTGIETNMVGICVAKTKSDKSLIIVTAWQKPGIIKAMDLNGKVAWEKSGVVCDMPCNPHGISADNSGRVYIADGKNRRVIVLETETGHEIQTLLTKEDHSLGMVYNVGWSHDTNEENYLTVNHTIGQDKEKIQQISVFRISSRAPNLEAPSLSVDAETISKAYKYACVNDSRKIFRAKVNLIGHQGVGKSSVLRSLLGLPFVEEHNRTEGIECKGTKCDLKIAQTENWKPLNKHRKEICKEDLSEQIIERLHKISISEDQSTEAEAKDGNDEQKESAYVNVHSPGIESPVMPPDCAPFPPLYENPRQEVDESTLPDPDSDLVNGAIGHFNRQQSCENQEGNLPKTGPSLQIGFWDYGGQIEYYATHHMFLDSDSINVLVLDVTKKLDSQVETERLGRFGDKGAAIPQTVIDFVHYWLNTIYTYVVDRTQHHEEANAKVLLALTHKDKLDSDPLIRNQEIEQFINNLLRNVRGKAYAHLLSESNIFCVDNKHGDPEEFKKLKGAIIDLASKKIGWGASVPVRWLQLETLLYKEAQSFNGNVVPVERAEEIAAPFVVHAEEFNDFMTFYHAMGHILHFPELDSKEYLITSPQWLIELFASIIRYPRSKPTDRRLSADLTKLEDRGIVDEDLLSYLWQKYQIDLDFLIKLMCKFDLMIPDPGDEVSHATPGTIYIPRYLVPCMLPVCDVAQIDSMLRNDPSLTSIAVPLYFKSKDNFIPIGTFQRLLCHCSKMQGWQLHGDIYYNAGTFRVGYSNDILVRLTCQDISFKVECWNPNLTLSGKTHFKTIYEVNGTIQQGLTSLSMSNHFETTLFPCEPRGLPLSAECLVQIKDIVPTGASQGQKHSSYKSAICKVHLTTLTPEKYATWFTGKPFPSPRAIPQDDEKFLHATSRAVSSDANLTDLGMHLGLKQYEVGAIRTDHQQSIQEAAFHLLLHWYSISSQENSQFRQGFREILKQVFLQCAIPWLQQDN